MVTSVLLWIPGFCPGYFLLFSLPVRISVLQAVHSFITVVYFVLLLYLQRYIGLPVRVAQRQNRPRAIPIRDGSATGINGIAQMCRRPVFHTQLTDHPPEEIPPPCGHTDRC